MFSLSDCSSLHELIISSYLSSVYKRMTNVCADPMVFTDTEEVVQDMLIVGEEGTITFITMTVFNKMRVLKDGIKLALDGTDAPEIQYNMTMEGGVTTHTLTIPTVTEDNEGMYQFEVETSTGRIVEYHQVDVKCKLIMCVRCACAHVCECVFVCGCMGSIYGAWVYGMLCVYSMLILSRIAAYN